MKTVRFALTLLVLSFLAPWQSAKAADVICYNCPPEWADWASMLKAIKADLNYDIPHDNKNLSQALSQILAEKNDPVGDIGYFRRLLDHDSFRHARPVREQGCARWQAGAGLLERSALIRL